MKRTEPAQGHARSRVSQTAPSSAWLSAAMWGMIEQSPAISRELREAEAELEAGGGVLYEVRGSALLKARQQG